MMCLFLYIMHKICPCVKQSLCTHTIISISICVHLCYNTIVPRERGQTPNPNPSPTNGTHYRLTYSPTAILDNFTHDPPARTRIKASKSTAQGRKVQAKKARKG